MDYSLLVGIQKVFDKQHIELELGGTPVNVDPGVVRAPTPIVQLEQPPEETKDKLDSQGEGAKLDFAERK